MPARFGQSGVRLFFVAIASVLAALIAYPSAQTTDIVLYPADVSVIRGNWARLSSTTGAGGQKMSSADRGWSTPNAPLAAPADYFEASFDAAAGVPYRLWLRLRAVPDSKWNESVWVQFSDAITGSGASLWPIGSTSALLVNLEDCKDCGVSGWGWQDNAWWLGTSSVVRFAAAGAQTIRLQTREDGVDVDQIVLSPEKYFASRPGLLKNDQTIVPKSGSTPAVTLLRAPYLQQVSDSGAIVVWTTREPGPADVRYASGTGPATTVAADTRLFTAAATGLPYDFYQHEARLTGLAPATRYTYDIFVGGVDATPAADSFSTAPREGSGGIRFIAFGDSGVGSTAQRQLADRMTADSFDLALHAGDVAYGTSSGIGGGSYRQFDDWVFGVYRSWMRSRPFFPSIGNHDNQVANAQPYLDVFVLPENGASGAYPDHAERYYSFDYGPVHFVALDTELAFAEPARRQAQLQWLEADLSGTLQPWRVVFFHRPPFSAGQHHGSELAVRAAFAPLFEEHGVQLVIAAHEHDYERSTPWRQFTAGGQAVTYIVTGGGGGPLYPNGFGSWTATSASVHHYVRAAVVGCTLTLEAVGLNGAAFDRFNLDRCAQSADAMAPTAQITAPPQGSRVSGPTEVRVDASDDVLVTKVDLYVDGVLRGVDAASPYTWMWDTRTVTDGPHVLQARAHDIAGRATSSASRSVTVANGASTPKAIPGTIEAEDFDLGPNGTAYFDVDAGNRGGQYRSTDVDIERCAEGGFNVGWIARGEWLNYTVNVASAGTYALELRVASPGGAAMHVEFDGADKTGSMTVPATGGWQMWTTIRKVVTLSAGAQVMRLAFDTGGHNVNSVRLAATVGCPCDGTPRAVPGTIQLEDFDEGGLGVAYHDKTPGNTGGQYRVTDVDIERTGDATGAYNIGWAVAGEWLTYTVNVASAGTYTLTARVASPGTGGTFHVEFNGADASGALRVPSTGGWQVYSDVTATIRLDPGVQVMRLVMDSNGSTGGVGNFNFIRVGAP